MEQSAHRAGSIMPQAFHVHELPVPDRRRQLRALGRLIVQVVDVPDRRPARHHASRSRGMPPR
jgi:hypothetical protein